MRLIDADAPLKDIEDLKRSPWYLAGYISDERRLGMKEALDMMSSIIRNSSTMDAIPVVRCKDCKHHHGTDCEVWDYRKTEDDKWCAWVERKEE